jgi:cytochrome o ubiquinol oxidase subunit 2
MSTQLNLDATTPGTYAGLSGHFSGDGFSGMHFDVRAVDPAQFAAWVSATRGAGPALDDASYAELEKQSMNVAPFTYRTADPDLFARIASQKLPPGPGPQAGESDPGVSPRTEK